MRMKAACICCLLNKEERQLREDPQEEKKVAYLKELMRMVGESGPEANAPWLAARIEEIYGKYYGVREDYGAVKETYNRMMMEREQEFETLIRNSEDPLRTALRYARVGNFIDFSALDQVDHEEMNRLFEREGDEIDSREYGQFLKDLEHAGTLVYLLDNCGEIVLDKLTIRLLKERYPNLEITGVVRGFPVVNDATMEDARMTGLDQIIPVMGNGDRVAGTNLSDIDPQVRDKICSADVILAKGQGNFETLHGCGLNIYYLFLCKCDWFMHQFQAERFQGMFVNEKRVVTGNGQEVSSI